MPSLAPTTSKAQTLEELFGDLPDEGKPRDLTLAQCLLVAKRHVLAGEGAADLAKAYGYSTGGMSSLLEAPFMSALVGKLFRNWSSGAETAAAMADAAAPLVMQKVINRAVKDNEWEPQKFLLQTTLPKQQTEMAVPVAPPIPVQVVNNINLAFAEMKSLFTTGSIPSLDERLLHGTEGIDLAEPDTTDGAPGPASSLLPAVAVEAPDVGQPG